MGIGCEWDAHRGFTSHIVDQHVHEISQLQYEERACHSHPMWSRVGIGCEWDAYRGFPFHIVDKELPTGMPSDPSFDEILFY